MDDHPGACPSPMLDAEPRPLAISAKLLYGVGEMPITVLMVLSGLFIQLALDAVGDPSIGHLSDRSRHRLGRQAFMLPGRAGHGAVLLFAVQSATHAGGISEGLCGNAPVRRGSKGPEPPSG